MVQHCLVHWLNEDRWDVFHTNRLPAEHRHEGAMAMLPWGPNGEQFLGKVIKISSNLKTVEKAERILSKEIKEKQSVVKGKRKSLPTNRSGSTASDAQVSKALGERKKLSSAQAQQKKDAASAKRIKTKVQEAAEQDEDSELLGVSVVRKLNFDKTSQPVSSIPNKAHDILSDEEGSCSDADDYDDDEFSLHLSDDNEDDDDDDAAGTPVLNDFKNPNTVAFLEHLLTAFTPTAVRCESVSSVSKEFAKPLLDDKQKMVHLKKGFSLMIPKGAKAKLLVDTKSRKSPTVFLRKTLTEVYGSSQLAQMTAKGRCDGSIGISDSDLAAIYSFVSEYSEGKDLDWPKFIETINKKCSSFKSPRNKSKSNKRKSTASGSDDETSAKLVRPSVKEKNSTESNKSTSDNTEQTSDFNLLSSSSKQKSLRAVNVTPMKQKSPRKSPAAPLKSPHRSPWKSPAAPLKSPHRSPWKSPAAPLKSPQRSPLKPPPKSPWKVITAQPETQQVPVPVQAHYSYQPANQYSTPYYPPYQHYGYPGYAHGSAPYNAQPLQPQYPVQHQVQHPAPNQQQQYSNEDYVVAEI